MVPSAPASRSTSSPRWHGHRFLETAAGRVGRVTGVNEDGGLNEIYLYQQDDRWIYLDCWAPGPHDDFATIAESFEFLPTE
jgi:hypothetical protein